MSHSSAHPVGSVEYTQSVADLNKRCPADEYDAGFHAPATPGQVRPRSIDGQEMEDSREGLMADKSQGTWCVAFEVRRRWKRDHARATETFPNEREAKKFARAKLAETSHVTAGTLNPYLLKRTIAAAQMLEWLEERDEDDLA